MEMLLWAITCLLLPQTYGALIKLNITTNVYTATKDAEIAGKISTNGILEVTKAMNEIECTRKCGRSDGCVSFHYNKNTQRCHLHGIEFSNLTGVSFTQAPGYCFYRMTEEYHSPNSACKLHYLQGGVPNGPSPTDCSDILLSGKTESGVYTVYLSGEAINVYCDQNTDGGGWLVFQRRRDGSEDFFRNWMDYEEGFGNICNEFWLGNKFLAKLTSQRAYTLRIDLQSFDHETRFAVYGIFDVGDVSTSYTLHVGSYSGTAGNSFERGNGHSFTTKDRDNDIYDNGNCAVQYSGAWWYEVCHESNLNGLYLVGTHTSYADGVNWGHFKGYHYSLQFTEMKVRPT